MLINKEKNIFLTAPSGMFPSITVAKNCARSLQAFLKYKFEKENIKENTVMIGISNVNTKKAHYIPMQNGVGRPKRVLTGDIENCFVDPHLHILISGDKAEDISADIIDYLIDKSIEYGALVGARIWKNYIKTDYEVAIVDYYIEKQSFSTLGVNRSKKCTEEDELQLDDAIIDEYFSDDEEFIDNEQLDLFEYLNKDSEVITEIEDNIKDTVDYEQNSFNFDDFSCSNKNINNTVAQMDVDYFIADLRTKWRYLQQMKRIAVELIANYEIAYYTSCLQNEICQIADAVKKYQSNIYINRIREITLKAEQIGTTIEVQKKAHELAFQKRTNLTSDDMYHLDYCGN